MFAGFKIIMSRCRAALAAWRPDSMRQLYTWLVVISLLATVMGVFGLLMQSLESSAASLPLLTKNSTRALATAALVKAYSLRGHT